MRGGRTFHDGETHKLAILTERYILWLSVSQQNWYSYGHLSVITGYKWDYTFYKWGYKYL